MDICAERLTDSQISFIHKNNKNFKEGEVVTFEESNIVASITTIETPSINVSTRYTFDNGQKESFYDYGFLTRKSDAKEPNRKLRVYFASGYYESTDDGDITTAQSYNSFDYDTEVQTVNNIRNTDIIDIKFLGFLLILRLLVEDLHLNFMGERLLDLEILLQIF